MLLPYELKCKVIQYLHFEQAILLDNFVSNKLYIPNVRIWDSAVELGKIEVIKWLSLNRKRGCTTWAMDFAAENGHLEVVKWLHEFRTEGCTNWAMDWAANRGHLDVVEFLHSVEKGCTTDAMDWAACGGYLEIVKFLHFKQKRRMYDLGNGLGC
jgi:Ankyrin repeats (3 copies)